MNSKFIQLTTKKEEALFINPVFISSIETRLNASGVSLSIVRTIDAKEHYVMETVELIIKKIKESEKFITFNMSQFSL
jgi:hypothetical protein